MIIAALALAGASFAGLEMKCTASKAYVAGTPYLVHVDVRNGGKSSESIDVWRLEPTGFEVNGKPLGKRDQGHKLELVPGAHMLLDLDLGPALADSAETHKPFKIAWGDETFDVTCYEPAPKGVDYMNVPVAELSKYFVSMQTNRGTMFMEFWPDVAPGHVRNFLDLCATGFYDSSKFHRVIPGFMIQGGDKNRGDGTGDGPRKLQAEFSTRKHEPGVLSMARQGTPNVAGPQDPLKNTASCQFFVMHAASPQLDGNYSAFGKLVEGLDVVERIVNTRRTQGDRPVEPQVIERAQVVRIVEK